MSTPRDLVLWLLEHGYETEYFKLSVADQAEWHDAAVLEADRLKTVAEEDVYQEYLSRLNGLGVKITIDSNKHNISRKRLPESDFLGECQAQKVSTDSRQNDLTLELKRSIDLRDKGEYEESLKVLNLANESGLKSDLIDDNRARALVKLRRIPEALAIWKELINSDNQRVKDNSRKFMDKFIQDFRDKLTKVCVQNSWEVVWLKDQCNNFEELEKFVLKEVIELRNAGNPELSLRLIERAQQLGFQSSMLIDNKARAFVALKRLPDAVDAWSELLNGSDENISNNAKKMIDKFDALAANSIKIKVNNVASEFNVELMSLNAAENLSLSELENSLLKDIIAVRESGNDEASLKIIDSAISAGVKRNERLLDNRARALNNLNRFTDAIGIWRELQKSDNESIREKSRQFADNATQRHLQYIHGILVSLCRDKDWKIQKLLSKYANLKDLKKLILQEAIAARQSGHPEFSIQLIEKSFELGLSSPRLKDNQARALINLQRLPEAVSIWREMLNSMETSGFDQQIHRMLDEYGLLADRICIAERCSEYAVNGDIDAAKNIAINAFLEDPEWDQSINLLKDILKIELGEAKSPSLLDRELENQQLDLQSYALLVNHMERCLDESVL